MTLTQARNAAKIASTQSISTLLAAKAVIIDNLETSDQQKSDKALLAKIRKSI